MRTTGPEPVELLSPTGHRVGGGPALGAADRRALPEDPVYGSRRMTIAFERFGETVNGKRVQRLMALMGLEALFPGPRTTIAALDTRVYPCLLRDRELTRANEDLKSDIYINIFDYYKRIHASYGVIDWFSRYVFSWRLSNTLEGRFCLEALDESLSLNRPEIFISDQGSRFVAYKYASRLEEAGSR
jgi:putative transposase